MRKTTISIITLFALAAAAQAAPVRNMPARVAAVAENEPEIEVEIYGPERAEANATVMLEALSDASENAVCRWTDQQGNFLGEGYSIEVAAEVSTVYRLEVTDTDGSWGAAYFNLYVTGERRTATFDDLHLPEAESSWCGYADAPDMMMSSFFSGSYEFNNFYWPDYQSWGFFGYSNSTDTSFVDYATSQFNNAVGGGFDGSANYCVAYISDFMGRTYITNSNTEGDEVISGLWLTNEAWVVNSVYNGDGLTDSSFAQGDWVAVTFIGLDSESNETGRVTYYLADYRSENEADHYCLESWQWIDLSQLGAVHRVQLTMDGSKKNAYGLTTPTYVCLDNVGGERRVVKVDPVLLSEENPSFPIAPLFSFGSTEATVEYSLEADPSVAVIEGDVVTVVSPEAAPLSLMASATSRGETEYVEIPVELVTGISAARAAAVRYDAVSRTLSHSHDSEMTMEIYDMAGRRVAGAVIAPAAGMSLAELPAGVYVARCGMEAIKIAIR